MDARTHNASANNEEIDDGVARCQFGCSSEEAVAAFHEKERIRWDEVYDEVYVEGQYGELEYYPGDLWKQAHVGQWGTESAYGAGGCRFEPCRSVALDLRERLSHHIIQVIADTPV